MDSVKREFFLNGNVSEESVKDIIAGIFEVNKYDDEQEKKVIGYNREPIKLIINTYGGSVYDGFALVSAIDSSVTPVYTYCLGKAMSMGFMIFASGHKRIAHPLATFMYHQISSVSSGFIKEMEEEIEHSKRLQEAYDRYILSRTNLPNDKLEQVKATKSNWYMFADEAIEYGLVDELLERQE